MISDLTWQALRRRRWSLAGPAVTQLVGALVFCATAIARSSVADSIAGSQAHHPAVAQTLEYLAIFHGNARFLTLIIVGVTMTLTMTQQQPDIALLRSLGASPAQTRRSLLEQAGLVTVPAVLAGFALSIPVAAWWLTGLPGHTGLSHEVQLHLRPSVLGSALLVVLVAALVGTLCATVPASRRSPARAAVMASTHRPISKIRVAAGACLLVAGVALSIVLATMSAEIADAAGIFILLGESLAVGLLGPLILAAVARALRPFAGQGVVRLAVDSVNAVGRSLSGALIPLILAISFSTIQTSMASAAARAGQAVSSADAWLTATGTGCTALFAAVAALNCLITVGVGRSRQLATMRTVGADRRTLLRASAIEAVIFSVAALVIGAAISLCTLIPVLGTAYHQWLPSFSLWGTVVLVVATVSLVAVGMLGVTAALTARRGDKPLNAGAA